MTSAKERRLPRDPGASINVMPLRALADLGIPYYEPAKSDQGYYSGVQCRLAKSHRQDSSLVCADLKTEVTSYVIDGDTS